MVNPLNAGNSEGQGAYWSAVNSSWQPQTPNYLASYIIYLSVNAGI